MTTLVLKLLKSKFAAAGAALIIALLVILMGPRFGLRSPWNFVVAGVILLGWLAWFLYKRMQERKNASALEGFLNQQADDQLMTARPDVKDEIAALKEKLEKAVKILKQSKLAKGQRGANALYVLPWYMIIGPPACGKSTAIRNSGLSFPPIDTDSESPGAIKGLGGTRNCDWWFTTDGIVLDTAGRYTISVDAAEDREEWTSFLGLLKRFRKKSPINGLLVMVSVDELMQQSDEGLESHARNIRARIDELINKLEIIFPVYLVFTKCDLISGFVEFFGDYSKREREQVWGYTRPYDEQPRMPLHEEFKQQTAELLRALHARRLRKLRAHLRPGEENSVYLFPMEFATVRRRLTNFVEVLFQPNPFQQDPALRGVYFTSGTQEGTPIGQVMQTMAKEFAIPEDVAPMLEPPQEKKAYFIKDLFTQVIMPDQEGVRPTSGSVTKGRWLRAALAAGVGIVTILLVIAFGTSYFSNRELLADTHERIQMIDDVGNRATDIDDLERLERVQNQLALLDRYEEEGPGWHRRWGLYKGNAINEHGREKLLAKLTPMLMQPTVNVMEDYLVDLMAADTLDTVLFSQVAAVYRELTDTLGTGDLDAQELVRQAIAAWGRARDELWLGDFRDPAGDLMAYWWKHRDDPALAGKTLEKNQSVYAAVIRTIQENTSLLTVYEEIIRQANRNLVEIDVRDIVAGTVLSGDTVVPGAYTVAGWEQEIQDRFKQARRHIMSDELMLEAFGDRLETIEEELLEMYYSRYGRAWQEFIENLQLQGFDDIGRAIDGISELKGGENSPIIIVLKKAEEHSVLRRDGERVEAIERKFRGIRQFLGSDDEDEEATRLERYFERLEDGHGVLSDGEGLFDAGEDCGNSLRDLARDLSRAEDAAEDLIVASGSGVSRAASNLLGLPFESSRRAAYTNACRCLNMTWRNTAELFDDELADKYPFNRHGTEADISTVIRFFGYNGVLHKFHEDEVKPAERAGMSLSGSYGTVRAAGERIRDVISGTGLNVVFVLEAEARGFDNLARVTFELGEDRLRYSMGSPKRERFTWTGQDVECSITAQPVEGARKTISKTGPWSLFKMFDEAVFEGSTVKWSTVQQFDARYTLSGQAAGFIRRGGFRFAAPSTICGN